MSSQQVGNSSPAPGLPCLAGLGFKPQFGEALLAQPGAVGFIEVHAENYMVAGGYLHQQLAALHEYYPLSIHGVGASIGGEHGLNKQHLQALAELNRRYHPESFSEHLAWSTHSNVYLNDLLPCVYSAESLRRVVDHIDQMQQALGRRVLIENPSTYVAFSLSNMSETDFINSMVQKSGCGLLLDVNNIYVSAQNHGFDPLTYLQALPLAAASEIHLAGFAVDQNDVGIHLLIDDHGAAVAGDVWQLYRAALKLTGPLPTLIERDNNIPELDILLGEIAQADALIAEAATREVMVSHA